VCDGCAGNCNKHWKSFFAINPLGGFMYLRSTFGIPPAPFRSQYDLFTAAIAQPPFPDDCPSPDWGCNYAPSAVEGIAERLFYEGPTGYAECYTVDARSNMAIQTVNIGWRTTWTEIVSAKFMSKTPGRTDFFCSQPEGHVEFYQTRMIGDLQLRSTNPTRIVRQLTGLQDAIDGSPMLDINFMRKRHQAVDPKEPRKPGKMDSHSKTKPSQKSLPPRYLGAVSDGI
jgi:hypothetical protein